MNEPLQQGEDVLQDNGVKGDFGYLGGSVEAADFGKGTVYISKFGPPTYQSRASMPLRYHLCPVY